MRPKVLSEWDTLELLHNGTSIGRVGDGELNIMVGRPIKSQDPDQRLGRMMRDVLVNSGKGNFITGIVPNDGRSPNTEHVKRCWINRYSVWYSAKLYGSAYITRPDCAPHINTPEYWRRFEDLWRDQDVILVRGSGKSLTQERMGKANSCWEIMAPRHNAFAEYDDLLAMLKREAAGRRILLCLGPTATALAYDLAQAGHHALDLGHVGMFLKRHWRAEREAAARQTELAA